MDTEQQPATGPQPDQPGWGAPPPPPEQRPKWSVRRTVVAVAIAVGIAAAGGVAIYAASGTVDNGGGPGGRGGVVMGGPMSDAEHGEFQNGEVTSISDTEATVESKDGFTRTYVIDDETELGDDIEAGDDVMVIATTEDETATASLIMEQGVMPHGPNGGGPARGNGPDDGRNGD